MPSERWAPESEDRRFLVAAQVIGRQQEESTGDEEMNEFAKLFYSDDVGQVLVVLDSDEGPEIRISFKPKGLGVCSLKLGFSDTDEGWEKAEHVFAGKVSEDLAISTVRKAMADLPISEISAEAE